MKKHGESLIPRQKELIHKTDWDYLIVLDACRYDFFEENYRRYLKGSLEKVRSEGTTTLEWLEKTFDGTYNFLYLSANPYINSREVGFENWTATEHFKNIYDAWLHDWDDERGTVPPERVSSLLKENSTDRVLAHYIQPHRPYLVDWDSMNWDVRKRTEGLGLKKAMRKKFGKAFEYLFGNQRRKTFSKLLFGEKALPEFERTIRKHGKKKIIDAYEKSLSIVLDSISSIVTELDEKIIITADHGEAFGEKGQWGHGRNANLSNLREVPWLEVEK